MLELNSNRLCEVWKRKRREKTRNRKGSNPLSSTQQPTFRLAHLQPSRPSPLLSLPAGPAKPAQPVPLHALRFLWFLALQRPSQYAYARSRCQHGRTRSPVARSLTAAHVPGHLPALRASPLPLSDRATPLVSCASLPAADKVPHPPEPAHALPQQTGSLQSRPPLSVS